MLRSLSLAALLCATPAFATAPAEIAVLHAVEWSPGDTVREGAGEFVVLLRAAQLQRTGHAAGLLAVGDHNGVLRAGGERALRRVALSGVVVAKLARGGEVAWAPDQLYVDAGRLNEARAQGVLARALELHGAPPSAADPDQPTAREIGAIQAHLRKLQAVFALEAGAQLALR